MESATENFNDTGSLDNLKELSDEELIYRYCETYGIKSRGALVPHAPAVFIISRMEGIVGCAAYFSKTLNTKVTKKQVEGILFKIRNGLINVTQGDLRLAAQAHPRAQAYFRMYPAALSPKTKMEDEKGADVGVEILPNHEGVGDAGDVAGEEIVSDDSRTPEARVSFRDKINRDNSTKTNPPSPTNIVSANPKNEKARRFGDHFRAASASSKIAASSS
jgi:hypothetical protein